MNPIWKVFWVRPYICGEESDPLAIHRSEIFFKLQHDGIYTYHSEWENNQYRYRCMDCFMASGSEEYTFATRFEKAKFLREGPTQQQQDEMNEQTRQHSIMWSWARSLK